MEGLLYFKLLSFVEKLHGFRTTVPIGTRPAASGSAGNLEFTHNRYSPLHNHTPMLKESLPINLIHPGLRIRKP